MRLRYNFLKYNSLKAVQYGVPILGGSSGIGLTLDSLLRTDNKVELGIGLLAAAIATAGIRYFKRIGDLANRNSMYPSERRSSNTGDSRAWRGSSQWPDENWGTPSDFGSGDDGSRGYD